jgi:hypothetical protein
VTTPEVREYLMRAMAVLQQKNPPPPAGSA